MIVLKIEQDWTRLNKIWLDWTRFDKIEQDLTRFNKIWLDSTRFDKIWQYFTRVDKIWQDLTRFDEIWQDYNFLPRFSESIWSQCITFPSKIKITVPNLCYCNYRVVAMSCCCHIKRISEHHFLQSVNSLRNGWHMCTSVQ